ncbi:hypothetical protein [Nocardioides antri]|uniref:Sensor domain-containing protein n=1 Tax=Nocardioides antri TaxID=2607659 RepID=A0A5B1M8W7_9ACTN|nr:hypothetical protein [Nocardioides antri]KAA1428357.1 hypothetical protein F0U47_05360 [Nocardioides antri]
MPLRSTLVGAASGILLLAGVFGFAVGLPEVEGDEIDAPAEAEEQEEADDTPVGELLPATLLDGALVRYSDVQSEYAALFDEVEGYGADTLTEAFGEDTAVGVYTTSDEQVRVAVTIYAGGSGLFLQTGPPVPPELSANNESVGEYSRQGESVCFGQWQTQAFEQKAPPFQAQCQREVAGRTINVYAVPGITVEQTADIVDDVVTQSGLG